ncbi:MAG: Nramp family divalent metal transporter [Candidatus Omnitrophica bacterium]|nr:Nramp family divalent metal transporter [Candidatus Omnitrophota bacterium]
MKIIFSLLEKFRHIPLIKRILFFAAILGPGFITGSVDNDAGGITTYSVAGALYGYELIWTLIPCFIALVIVQEMNLRMGIHTGKGLADLIRENFGVKFTFFLFFGLFIADIGNTATEFAGVAGSLQIFGISKYISVPLTALGVWFLVTKGNYKITERIFLLFSFCLLSYVVSAILAKPHWAEIGAAVIKPNIHFEKDYILLVLGIIGTTIAPWMQFYMQSAVIERGTKPDEYKYALADVIVGCVATVVVAFFIMVSCAATLHQNGVVITEAKDAAMALRPFAGDLASEVFAFGLFIASVFSATILPLATSFYICQAFGFEAGIDKRVEEAPQFYTLFATIMAIGVAIILIPNAPLIGITIWAQIINALLLPLVLISMVMMVNNKDIMGEHVNNRFQNIVAWSTTGIIVLLSLTLVVLPVVSRFVRL